MQVRFGGGEQLDALAKRMHAAAEQDLFVKAAGDAMESMRGEIGEAVTTGTERLPSTGGLAAQVARTRLGFQVKIGSGSFSMRIVAHPNAVTDPGAIDRGRVRHLSWGRKPWHIQLVTKGWFTEPIRDLRPRIRAKVQRAVSEALRKV